MTAMSNLNIEQARFNMIEQQIRTWEVLDPRVLEVLTQTPREQFVPEQHRALAFADIEVPLGHGQSMLPPKLEGRILQVLALQASDRVLEIGTGSGYLTACLAKLAGHVESIDIYPDFTVAAQARLVAHGITHCKLGTADAARGWSLDGPFDAIVVSGSVPIFVEAFQTALAPGGRLFVVVGSAPAMRAWLITRVGAQDFRREGLFETVLAPLCNAVQPERFFL